MRKYRVGIPQLTWLYVDVEVDDTDPGDPEFVMTDDEAKEIAIESALEEGKRHKFCANCEMGNGGWRREIDDLGTLVDAHNLKIDYDVVEGGE